MPPPGFEPGFPALGPSGALRTRAREARIHFTRDYSFSGGLQLELTTGDPVKDSGAVDNYLPEPPYQEFYKWCFNQAPDREGRGETCRKYVNYLNRFNWPLSLLEIQTAKLNNWQIMSLRAYLRFLSERGYDVSRWLNLSVLKKKRSGSRKYIPRDSEVAEAINHLNNLPEYKLVYILILYTALRLEHTVRLLRDWLKLKKNYEDIAGDCIRIPLPWISGPKRAFYAYMPRWLYNTIKPIVLKRSNVSNIACKKKILAPTFVRKYALHHMARLLGPQVAAHIAGHSHGSELFPALVRDEILEQHYISIEDLAARLYHRYANEITNKFKEVIIVFG